MFPLKQPGGGRAIKFVQKAKVTLKRGLSLPQRASYIGKRHSWLKKLFLPLVFLLFLSSSSSLASAPLAPPLASSSPFLLFFLFLLFLLLLVLLLFIPLLYVALAVLGLAL